MSRLFDSKNHLLTRLSCSAYVASFISRAQFIPFETIRCSLTEMTKWAHNYVEPTRLKIIPDADLHGLFYSVCQSIFYIICFHYHRIFADDEGREYFNSLNLERLTSAPLNPLKFCLPTIIKEFGRICGTQGLLSCCETIEKVQVYLIPSSFSRTNLWYSLPEQDWVDLIN